MKTREQLEQEIDSAIEDGARAFVRLGNALAQIRDERYYKEAGYSRFEDYTQEKWEFTRVRAYQLIDAARVYEYLSESFDNKHLPRGESAIRKMGRLSKEQCIDIWRKALERSPKPSRALITELVNAA